MGDGYVRDGYGNIVGLAQARPSRDEEGRSVPENIGDASGRWVARQQVARLIRRKMVDVDRPSTLNLLAALAHEVESGGL